MLLACKNTQEAALSTQTFVFVNNEERLARVCAYTERRGWMLLSPTSETAEEAGDWQAKGWSAQQMPSVPRAAA